jgi:oligosaccharide translocation protein RFT1
MTLLGLVIFFFAVPYAEPFIYLYGGPSLAATEAPKLLTAHAFYVVFLAVNGVTECYSFACMTKDQLER